MFARPALADVRFPDGVESERAEFGRGCAAVCSDVGGECDRVVEILSALLPGGLGVGIRGPTSDEVERKLRS